MSRKRQANDLLELGEVAPGLLSERHLEFNGGKKLCIAQKPAHSVGSFLWDCAIVLCHYLCNEKSFPAQYFQNKKVLELGAGTGAPGIVSSLLGANVTLTDTKENLELLRTNARKNKVTTASIKELPWGSDISTVHDDTYDLVLMSDCIYEDANFHELLQTLLDVTTTDTKVICTYKKRYPDKEGEFFRMLQEHFHVEMVAEDVVPRPNRIGEILVMQFTRKSFKL